jgi:hypothetical protein
MSFIFNHASFSSALKSAGASKEVGLELNPENTKYMLMSRSQNIGPNTAQR